MPGWDGECEWTGTVPFGEMPRVIDPAAGFVLTANNVIVDGDQPYISSTFAQPFRAERIRERLADAVAHTPEEPGRDAGGHGVLGGAGLGPALPRRPRTVATRRPRRRARDAVGLGRGPRRGLGPGPAVRVLPAGPGRGAVPAADRRRHLGMDHLGEPCGRRSRWSGGGWPTTPGNCSAARCPRPRTAAGDSGSSPRCPPRWPAPGPRPSATAVPTPPAGAGAMCTGPRARTRWTASSAWTRSAPVPMGGDADTIQAAGLRLARRTPPST